MKARLRRYDLLPSFAPIRLLAGAGARLLFPPSCMACDEEVPDAGTLCRECWQSIEHISGAICDGCARPIPMASAWQGGSLQCEECLGCSFEWDHARAATFYQGTARSLVLALKHGDRPDHAPSLAQWMARAGADILSDADLLIPIPLHWRRRAARRSNQAAELSRALSGMTGITHGAGILRRPRPTQSLGHLSASARRGLLSNAFQASRSVESQNIVLVDDVMTSGATMSEAAQVLRKAGARQVNVLVFARAARPLTEPGLDGYL